MLIKKMNSELTIPIANERQHQRLQRKTIVGETDILREELCITSHDLQILSPVSTLSLIYSYSHLYHLYK